MSGTPDNKRKRPVTPTKIDECGRKLEEIVELPGYNEENQSISSELKVTTNIALIGYSAAVTSEVQEDQAQEIVAPSNVDGEKQNDNSQLGINHNIELMENSVNATSVVQEDYTATESTQHSSMDIGISLNTAAIYAHENTLIPDSANAKSSEFPKTLQSDLNYTTEEQLQDIIENEYGRFQYERKETKKTWLMLTWY